MAGCGNFILFGWSWVCGSGQLHPRLECVDSGAVVRLWVLFGSS
jgi:hypothetical protein